MAANDLPNGFTGFSKNRPHDFESAKSAMDFHATSRSTSADSTRAARASVPAAPLSWQADTRPDTRAVLQFAADGARPNERGVISFDPEKLAAIPEIDRRWSWVEIDLNAIRHNTKTVRRSIAPGTHLMAVVKADAYGHGAVRCAKTALNSGADYLAVATVDEAIEL